MTRDEAMFVAGMKAGATMRTEGLGDDTILGLARNEFDRAMARCAPPEVVICHDQTELEKDNTPKRGRPRGTNQ